MTEEERCLKELRRQYYELKSINSKTNEKLFALAAAACAMAAYGNAVSLDDSFKTLEKILGLINASASVYSLRFLFDAIAEKTMYKSKIEAIDLELELDDLEKTDGKSM